jgi:hypothetical protein
MRTRRLSMAAAVLLLVVCPGIALLPVVAQQSQVFTFFVWEQTSPCLDSRQGWFVISTTYPGGGAAYQRTDVAGGSVATAGFEADRLKLGTGFERRACTDWAVLRNQADGRLSVQKMTPGAQLPFGFEFHTRGLTCEVAFDLAGIAEGNDCRFVQLNDSRVVRVRPRPGGPADRGTGFFVFERVSQCVDSRQEWFTVAPRNPGEVGSANRWESRSTEMSFAAASLVADKLKLGESFTNRCCQEWGVYEEAVTRKLWVFNHVKAQNIPARFLPAAPLHLCCESAFNLAGFPPGNDCRALKLSDGSVITRTPNRLFNTLPGASGPTIPAPPIVTDGGATTRSDWGTVTRDDDRGRGGTTSPRPCDAQERAMWARISGAWQATYGPVTFAGSCENVSGFWQQGDFPDPGAKLTQRGIIKNGRATATGVTFDYAQDWNKKYGTDSCDLAGDVLNCRHMWQLKRR